MTSLQDDPAGERMASGSVGLKKIAERAGVSKATVSRALRGHPSVRPGTRERILAIAAELGHTDNPLVGRVMSGMRRQQSAAFRGNLGLIWANQIPARGSDYRLLTMQASIRRRSEELGYRISEFSATERSPKSLMRLLWHCGIQGILIAAPSFQVPRTEVRFDLKDFCCVVVGSGRIDPPLHTVRFDYFRAMRLALHHARPRFGNGVAAVWDDQTNRRAHHSTRASFIVNHPGGTALGEKLFLIHNELTLRSLRTLVKRYAIGCLICESAVVLPEGSEELVPLEQRIVFKRPEGKTFGWIDTRNELLGGWAVDLLANKLSQWDAGPPAACETVLVPPRWFDG
ncbi:MAG TPA: LacI family DNA-binding transcriptional regulator [Chthoniobacteraceae bacterium]|nr:LacI family DNA-binding transcriptional regulator [Chthoniobacteraceae bacterium]